ncbi:hypothetical protein Save01_08157 [Streptomyces avermitilis]|uniref:FAD-binding domain-containing protein n=1 Tax=Streptomyces avermitilis TaxID=33903 RepID=A0A4D4MJC1_STRAX|nr:hypothetical protein SAVMC3_87450 [Streptomyces avermitilis]GDY68054.1 hypothetical protein SAV14893_074470 [Streptomyces avermitilis]GDY71609.1 hypothetical protein SAV31267_010940 [Streptomyces avermitilis]
MVSNVDVPAGRQAGDRTHPDLAAMVGRGNYWVLGNGQSLSAQRNGDGRVRIGLSFYDSAEGWFATSWVPFGDPAAARVRLIDLFTGWDSRDTALIAACDDTVLPGSITTLPVGPTWPSTPDVTLLGDAAHLMPPVGQGANMAPLDGALLGLTPAALPDDFPAAVEEHEREMFERTSTAGRQSAHVQVSRLRAGIPERRDRPRTHVAESAVVRAAFPTPAWLERPISP